MQQLYVDARSKTNLKTKMKVACLSIFILPLKMSRWNMRCYHSFRLNTKNKFQDKHKALSFTKRKPNENQVQESKTKFFKSFLQSNNKRVFSKMLSTRLKLCDWRIGNKHFCKLTPHNGWKLNKNKCAWNRS